MMLVVSSNGSAIAEIATTAHSVPKNRFWLIFVERSIQSCRAIHNEMNTAITATLASRCCQGVKHPGIVPVSCRC